jgi:hypothetical protein
VPSQRKTKSLSESTDFLGAWDLLSRLQLRFNKVDEVKKAAHLVQYHSLKQREEESGADYVDREQREFNILRGMGVQVDDSMRLTKFIQDRTTNSQHHVLAQTILSTPQITLSRATSLFEGYKPSPPPPVVVNALDVSCNYCKKRGHQVADCRKLKAKERSKERPSGRSTPEKFRSNSKSKKPRYPCGICDSSNHSAFQCPLKNDVMKCVKGLKQKESNWGKDEGDDDLHRS